MQSVTPPQAWFTFKIIFNTSARETVQNCSHRARWKPDYVPTDTSVAPNLLGRRHSRHPLASVALSSQRYAHVASRVAHRTGNISRRASDYRIVEQIGAGPVC